jgi:hypothetical protein
MADLTYNLNGAFKPPTKRFADLDGPDFYPTPPWATLALVEHEQFDGTIWEPACGDGAMSEVLAGTGCEIISTDLFDRGYGLPGEDFLESRRTADNVVTNPPYNSAEAFLEKALRSTTHKVALLLRLAFLEGGNRYRTIFRERPPARVWVFSERITFYPKGMERKGSGTTAYAWFVWDKAANGTTQLRWIPPGYKRRSLTQSENPRLFR